MLTIVIPAHNEELFIAATIERAISLLNGRIPYEIIVVDNASNDHTRAEAAKHSKVNLLSLKEKVTIAKARNTGAAEAAYNTVAFIDADVLLTNEWVEELLRQQQSLSEEQLQITGCRYSLSENPSWIERAWFKNMRTENLNYINSGNLITTKQVIQRTGGFNESLETGEDVEFCKRSSKEGVLIKINPRFEAHHEGYPKSLGAFFRRERWHGKGDLASISRFLDSKVAIFSFTTLLLLLTSVTALVAGSLRIAFFLLFLFFCANAYAIKRRFVVSTFTSAGQLFFLHVVYCAARICGFYSKRHR